MLRVLICEDSRTYAIALRRMLEYDGAATVAGVCATAEEAMAAIPRIHPDLVTMDIELPGLDGLTAVEEIMSSWPMPILVLSTHVGLGTGKATAALAAGALDALAKEDLDLHDPGSPAGAAFRHRIKVLGSAHVIRHPRARFSSRPAATTFATANSVPSQRLARRQPRPASVVGICASTGGPQVVLRLLNALPADYPIPVLVVQHIAAGFTDGMASWLDRSVQVPVGVARDGMPVAPGAWLAPEGAHLVISDGRLRLDRDTIAGRHRPSGDMLLRSIAEVAGRTGVAVVLSGMGSDGAAGAALVRERGGLAIAQDEASSAVFGMPKAAIDHGVDLVLSPGEIASCLTGLRLEPLPGARSSQLAGPV
jgi:two-component system, chemotaxis family, protein-glutamate methylesterase/glutaminase